MHALVVRSRAQRRALVDSILVAFRSETSRLCVRSSSFLRGGTPSVLVDGWVERTPVRVRVRVRCSRRARGRECGERGACRVNPATVVNPFPLGSLWLWLTGADLRDFFEFEGLFLSYCYLSLSFDVLVADWSRRS